MQDVVPTLHEVGFVVQAMPGVQAPHVPALQYRFEALVGPHGAPSASDVPRLTHVGVPVVQDNRPLWHGLAGLQAPPSLHAAHVPALQTICAPPGEEQGVPGGLFPLSTQTNDPVAQDVVPTLQALAVSHAWPAVQETHIPVRHTRLAPHTVAVPSAKGMFVSVHTAVPVSHASVPLWQGLVGGQAEPATQGMQVPSMHTLPVPQDVPLGLFPKRGRSKPRSSTTWSRSYRAR